jgi:RHS repeat-associated protein
MKRILLNNRRAEALSGRRLGCAAIVAALLVVMLASPAAALASRPTTAKEVATTAASPRAPRQTVNMASKSRSASPLVASRPAALAQSTGAPTCPNTTLRSEFLSDKDAQYYSWYVPAGGTLQLTVWISILAKDISGWDTNFYADPTYPNGIGVSGMSLAKPVYESGPAYNLKYSTPVWTNPGAATTIYYHVYNSGAVYTTYTLLAQVTGDLSGAPACQNPPSIVDKLLTLGTCNPALSSYDNGSSCSKADPVNAQTGNYFETSTDIAVPGHGHPLAVTRTYNALASNTNSAFGYGQTFNYGMSLDLSAINATSGPYIVLNQEGGSQLTFLSINGAWVVAGSDIYVTLTHNTDGTWTVVRQGEEAFAFDSLGRLIATRDRNGYVTNLAYSGSQLATVTNADGKTLTFAYNSTGQISTVTDQAARSVSYTYDSTGDLATVTDLRGGVTTFAYDSTHGLIQVTDPRGGVTKNAYDGTIGVKLITDQWDPVQSALGASGHPTHFDYSVEKQTTITDPDGRVEIQQYNNGQLTADTLGPATGLQTTTTYTYDGLTGGVASVTDPDGNVTTSTYTPQGWLASRTDGAGNTTTFGNFDAFGDPQTVTDPKGIATTYTYDADGNVKTQSTPLDTNGNTQVVTTWQHSDPSHPDDVTGIVDPTGKTSTIAPNSAGQPKSATDPAGNTTTYGYDLIGRRTWSVSGNGNAGGNAAQHRSSVVYDGAGDPLLTLDSATGAVTDSFQRPNGALGNDDQSQAWTTLGGGTWQIASNQATLTAIGTSASLATVPTPADGFALGIEGTKNVNYGGVAARIQDASNYWVMFEIPTYNTWSYGKMVNGAYTQIGTTGANTCCATGTRAEIAFSGGLLFFALNGKIYGGVYDTTFQTATKSGLIAPGANLSNWTGFAAGNNGGVTNNFYDANGNTTFSIDPLGRASNTVSDADNRPTIVGRNDGTTLKTSYDSQGRTLSQTDGANHTTTYTYDAQGRPATSTPAGQNQTTYSYTYGSTGEQDVVHQAGGGTVTTVLDKALRPHTITYSDGTTPNVTIGYDADSQRTSMTTGTTPDLWAYDSLGRQISATRAGRTVTHGYDNAGRVMSIGYPNGQTVSNGYTAGRWTSTKDWNNNVTSYTYDADNNLVGTTYPNGVVNGRTYTADDTISGVALTSGTTWLGIYNYTRNADQSLASVATSATQTYSYNNIAQLSGLTDSTTPANNATYGFDTADNPISYGANAQTFNAANQLCWSAPTASAGSNPTCTTIPTGATTYSYDSRGNRTTQTAPGGATTYTWDQANRLKATSASSSTYSYDGDNLRLAKTVGGTATNFTWDDTTAPAQLLQDGNDYYLYGPGGLPIERTNASGPTYLHQDQLGSTILLTTPAGTVAGSYAYSPWGQVVSHTGTTVSLQYSGEYTDGETGFQYLRNRYYDPATGQFMALDPALSSSRSAYGYVNDDPLNAVDPSGLCSDWNPVCVAKKVVHGAKKAVKKAVSTAKSVCIMHVTCPKGTRSLLDQHPLVRDSLYIVAGGAAVVASGGLLLEGAGMVAAGEAVTAAAGAEGLVTAGVGLVVAAGDYGPCFQGHDELACAGFWMGAVGGILGGPAAFMAGEGGLALNALGFTAGMAGVASDIGGLLENAVGESGCP